MSCSQAASVKSSHANWQLPADIRPISLPVSILDGFIIASACLLAILRPIALQSHQSSWLGRKPLSDLHQVPAGTKESRSDALLPSGRSRLPMTRIYLPAISLLFLAFRLARVHGNEVMQLAWPSAGLLQPACLSSATNASTGLRPSLACSTQLSTSTQYVPTTTIAFLSDPVPTSKSSRCIQLTVTSHINSIADSSDSKDCGEALCAPCFQSCRPKAQLDCSMLPPVTIFKYRTRIQTATLPIEYTQRLWQTTTKTLSAHTETRHVRTTVSIAIPVVETETHSVVRLATLPILRVETVQTRWTTTHWKTRTRHVAHNVTLPPSATTATKTVTLANWFATTAWRTIETTCLLPPPSPPPLSWITISKQTLIPVPVFSATASTTSLASITLWPMSSTSSIAILTIPCLTTTWSATALPLSTTVQPPIESCSPTAASSTAAATLASTTSWTLAAPSIYTSTITVDDTTTAPPSSSALCSTTIVVFTSLLPSLAMITATATTTQWPALHTATHRSCSSPRGDCASACLCPAAPYSREPSQWALLDPSGSDEPLMSVCTRHRACRTRAHRSRHCYTDAMPATMLGGETRSTERNAVSSAAFSKDSFEFFE